MTHTVTTPLSLVVDTVRSMYVRIVRVGIEGFVSTQLELTLLAQEYSQVR